MAVTEADGKVDVVALVRDIRASDQWIDSAKTFYLRVEGHWIRTAEEVALRRAELQKQFPGENITEERFPGLAPEYPDTVELAFDGTRAFSSLRSPDSEMRTVWDGAQLLVCTRTIRAQGTGTSYRLEKKYYDDLDILFGDISWLRSGKHVFWWQSEEAKRKDNFGAPEDFVLTGRENFRGTDCLVLMAPIPNSDYDYRWYVSAADHRLRGLASGWVRDEEKAMQIMAEIALREGKRSTGGDELSKWLDSLPAEKKASVTREYRLKCFAHFQPWRLNWLDDYREVSPGCWLPMKQGTSLFFEEEEVDANGRAFETDRYAGRVTQVRIDQELEPALFDAAATEEGASVLDLRGDVPVSYEVKKDRTEEEWAKIKADAVARAAQTDKGKRLHEPLVGQPAPAFTAGAQWLNSPGLKWSDLAGKVVIVDFWADWCLPCRNDLPVLAQLHQSGQAKGIVVVGIHPAGSQLDNIQKVMKQFDMQYPVIIDLPGDKQNWGKLFEEYGIEGLLYAFLVDGQGRIVAHGQIDDLVPKAWALAEKRTTPPATMPAKFGLTN